MNFRKLKASEIDVRVGSIGNGFFTLLLYKDARVDMDILDESNVKWQRRHYEMKGNLFCSVGIYDDTLKDWVWKDDCGVESKGDDDGFKKKGEASDSFKRACTNWGIGRELYTSPFIYIKCDCKKGQKSYDLPYKDFKVEEIDYKDKAISKLVITAKEGYARKEIFCYGAIKKPNNLPKFENIKQKVKDVVDNAKEESFISLEVINDVYYTGSLLGLTEEKVDEVVNKKIGKLKVEDLTLSEANKILSDMNKKIKEREAK
jgi:hypothetical protein